MKATCEGCNSTKYLSPVISDDNIYSCEKCLKSLNNENELLTTLKRITKITETLQMYALLGSAVEKHYCNSVVESALMDAKKIILKNE